MFEPGEAEIDAHVDQVCAWTGHVGLVQRIVAIAGLAGVDPEDLYDVAEREGFTRLEFEALLVDPPGGGG